MRQLDPDAVFLGEAVEQMHFAMQHVCGSRRQITSSTSERQWKLRWPRHLRRMLMNWDDQPLQATVIASITMPMMIPMQKNNAAIN
jgi:hypothetical protein